MKKLLSVLLCFTLLFAAGVAAFAADGAPASPSPDGAFFTYGDYTLHYRVVPAEEPRGQILLLHGFGQSSYAWGNTAKLLAEGGYTCVLVDLPDFGYSSREDAATTLLPRETLCMALMDSISPEPWIVAGHSMGGYTAIALAVQYPERVKTLLLYGTSGYDGMPAAVQALLRTPLAAKALGGFMEAFGKNPLVIRMLLKAALQDDAYAAAYDSAAIIEPFRTPGTGMGAVYNVTMLTPTDYAALYRLSPVLLMRGDRDLVIREEAVDRLRAALPVGSSEHIVRGGGHMFIENRAEETARYTLAFLEAHPIL